jgi:hypothetical protein
LVYFESQGELGRRNLGKIWISEQLKSFQDERNGNSEESCMI